MSYVSIWRPVNDRLVQASRESKNEIIGILLGKLDDDTIVIEDSITGEFSARPDRVILPSHTIAKIADGLLSGRTKGKIVGWYHSHIEGGLFFSDTDTETQKNLQQFSTLITGMVIDARTGDVGYFRVNPQTGKAVRVADEKVRIYKEPTDAISAEARLTPPIRPTPTIEVRVRPQLAPPMSRLIVSIVLIALVASLSLLGILFYQGLPLRSALTISHNPIAIATVGTPVEVKANVTGKALNVALFYARIDATPFTTASMASHAPSEYIYLIPGEQVTGNIKYYMKAFDASGGSVGTPTYQIAVSDFTFLTPDLALTVYRTRSATAELGLLGINGFSQQITLTASGAPPGLTVGFSPNPAIPGTPINMNFAANPDTSNGTFPIGIAATHTPAQGLPITRQARVMATVADFDLRVSPTSRTISGGDTTTYDVTLTIQRGFADPVMISVFDLPSDATFQTLISGNTILGAGPGTVTFVLQISTRSTVPSGAYTLTISGVGGGIVHSRIVTLTVR